MSFDPAKAISAYCAAFVAANKKPAPSVTYENGWFILRSKVAWLNGRMRYRELAGATVRLNARAGEAA
jgi:hypothetical protein